MAECGKVQEWGGHQAEIKIPFSREAEEGIIAAVLHDPAALIPVLERITPGDFHCEDTRRIFEAAVELNASGAPLDTVTLIDRIRATSNGHGNALALKTLEIYDESAFTAALAPTYAKRVGEYAKLRSVAEACAEIASGMDVAHGVSEYLERAQDRIFQITETKSSGPTSVADAMPDAIQRIEYIAGLGTTVTGLATGFPSLDELTCGLHEGELFVLAARPSMGKTALGMNIAETVALSGKGVLVFSLEMPTTQLLMRLVCSRTGVDMQRLRAGRINDTDRHLIASAQAELSQAKLYIDDSCGLTISQIRARARRASRDPNKNISLIVVDYLQLACGDRDDSREQEVSSISRGLKALAKELNVPVLALAQLNRAVEQRADKHPIMADLRDSGAIEQDADVIAFIYRDEVYNRETERPGVAEIIISKQRNGPIGSVELGFQGGCTRFYELLR